MDSTATDGAAFGEVVVFLRYFNDLPDPRQAVKVVYPLGEVLLLALLAVLAGADTLTDLARFGAGSDRSRRELRRMTRSAISLPPSMPDSSSAASLPGPPR